MSFTPLRQREGSMSSWGTDRNISGLDKEHSFLPNSQLCNIASHSNSWLRSDVVNELDEINEKEQISNLVYLQVGPGDYRMRIRLEDMNQNEMFKEYEVPLLIESFYTNSLFSSDIQLSSYIKRDQNKNIFNKNGFLIKPLSQPVFDLSSPMLFSYMEIYHLRKPASLDEYSYSVSYDILDLKGIVVKTLPEKRRKSGGNSAVDVNSLNVLTLESGTYIYRITVRDLQSGQVTVSNTNFFVYREADFEDESKFSPKLAITRSNEPSAGDMSLSNLDAIKEMSDKAVKEEIEYAKYISSKTERDQFNSIDKEAKRNFLMDFWKLRIIQTGNPDFRYEFLDRVEYANLNWKERFKAKAGWKSDRGRVYIQYGPPTEIETFRETNDSREYQIWMYNHIQGGVLFVFADLQDREVFQLIHSSANGEIKNYHWMEFINR